VNVAGDAGGTENGGRGKHRGLGVRSEAPNVHLHQPGGPSVATAVATVVVVVAAAAAAAAAVVVVVITKAACAVRATEAATTVAAVMRGLWRRVVACNVVRVGAPSRIATSTGIITGRSTSAPTLVLLLVLVLVLPLPLLELRCVARRVGRLGFGRRPRLGLGTCGGLECGGVGTSGSLAHVGVEAELLQELRGVGHRLGAVVGVEPGSAAAKSGLSAW